MSSITETPIEYRGWSIAKVIDPWCIRAGWVYTYHIDEHSYGAKTIEEAKSEIDERIAEQEKPNIKIKYVSPFPTPMTVTGDKAKLLTLQYALENFFKYVNKFKELYPESYTDTKEWLDVVNQAIKDAEIDANTLPFPQK